MIEIVTTGEALLQRFEADTADMRTLVDLHDRSPKPFKWTKPAGEIWLSPNASAKSPADFVWRALDSRD